MRWLRIFNQLILTLLEARRFNTSRPAAVLIREDSLCPPLLKCILEAALRRVCLVFLRCLFLHTACAIRTSRPWGTPDSPASGKDAIKKRNRSQKGNGLRASRLQLRGRGLFSKQHLVNFIGKQRFSSGPQKASQELWPEIPLFTLGSFQDSLKRLHRASIHLL